MVLGGETCPGNTPTAPDTVWCRKGDANFPATVPVTYDVGEPVVSWGVQCTGPTTTSLCFTGNGTDRLAHLHLQAAIVTVDDPVAPVVGVRRARRRRPAHERDLHRERHRLRRAPLPARARRRRRARRRALRLRLPPRRALRAGAHAATFDLAGVADGRHTVTTIAEDAASNVARTEQIVDVDGTPPVIDRVPVSGRTRLRARRRTPAPASRAGRSRSATTPTPPYTPLKTTLRDGRLTATVPRSFSMSSLGIEVSVADRAGNAVHLGGDLDEPLDPRRQGSARKVRNERATVGYGRAVTLLGRLTTVDGTALAGQPIVVSGVERRAGATAVDLGRVSTDARGRFSVTVPAGPSRDRHASGYPGAGGLLHRVREVALRVPASATIRAARATLSGQGAIRFSGRLRTLGAALPPGGKIVDLQASQRGRWSTVATTRTRGLTAPGAPSHASAAPRAATRSACASAAKRCSPTNWGTPLPWWYAYGEIRARLRGAVPACSQRPARAGTYDVVTCSPSGPGGVNNAWTASTRRDSTGPPDPDHRAWLLARSRVAPPADR